MRSLWLPPRYSRLCTQLYLSFLHPVLTLPLPAYLNSRIVFFLPYFLSIFLLTAKMLLMSGNSVSLTNTILYRAVFSYLSIRLILMLHSWVRRGFSRPGTATSPVFNELFALTGRESGTAAELDRR